VQRSAYPNRYAEIGYPLARDILDGLPDETEWPQRNIGFDSSGWGLDLETNAWIKTELKDAKLFTNKDGWLWAEPKTVVLEDWPWANNPVGYLGDGSYIDQHPTRYTWREDIDALARRVVNAFPGKVWPNTYVGHPPGWNRDTTSIDFWDYKGRGYNINPTVGQEVFEFIFEDPNPPWISWCIWWGYIWTSTGGWEVFNDDGTGPHMDHAHFTFL
jgi:hypothetical protein